MEREYVLSELLSICENVCSERKFLGKFVCIGRSSQVEGSNSKYIDFYGADSGFEDRRFGTIRFSDHLTESTRGKVKSVLIHSRTDSVYIARAVRNLLRSFERKRYYTILERL